MPDAQPHPADLPILSVRLRPHRSLSRGQVRLLLCAVAAGGMVTTFPFVLMGAWPVLGFMGLDVLAVSIAFTVNFRAARAYEDVDLTALELRVAKVTARGARAEWRFNPRWVRLRRQQHAEFGTVRLALESRGETLEVAGFLGPEQKAAFADSLAQGLAAARSGVRYS